MNSWSTQALYMFVISYHLIMGWIFIRLPEKAVGQTKADYFSGACITATHSARI